MSKEERIKYGCVSSFLFGLLFLALSCFDMTGSILKKTRCTIKTTGTVDYVQKSRYTWVETINVSFTVNGKQYFAKGDANTDTCTAKQVIVHYAPDNPKYAYAGDHIPVGKAVQHSGLGILLSGTSILLKRKLTSGRT